MLVRMRPLALLAAALGVLLPVACTAPAPSEPPARSSAVAPVAPPAVITQPVAQPSEPAAPITAAPVDDCGLRATITAARGQDGADRYTLTLKNEGAAARTLVTPGDGSEYGRRTPMLAWFGTRDGQPAPEIERPGCGMMNAIEASEIFTLEPGASRAMSTWLMGPSYGPGRYEVRLRYTNDPGKQVTGTAPEVAALLARTSACEVTSAPLVIEVR